MGDDVKSETTTEGPFDWFDEEDLKRLMEMSAAEDYLLGDTDQGPTWQSADDEIARAESAMETAYYRSMELACDVCGAWPCRCWLEGG